MSGRRFDRYGAILDEDVQVLEACLRELVDAADERSAIRVCEIGMHDGGTARGIENFVRATGRRLAYWGVDSDPGTTRPRHIPEGATVILGDSAEIFHQVPDELDLLWVDGCHCRNHVILDVINYCPKVRVGGFMCHHDVNPAGQGLDHQYHGPMIPEFGLAAEAALRAIGFPWVRRGTEFGVWDDHMKLWPTEVHDCGTWAFKRTG